MVWGGWVVSTISLTFIKPKANPAFKYIFLLLPPSAALQLVTCETGTPRNGWENFPSYSFSRYGLVSVWKFAVVYLYKYTQCYWSQFVGSSLMVFWFGFVSVNESCGGLLLWGKLKQCFSPWIYNPKLRAEWEEGNCHWSQWDKSFLGNGAAKGSFTENLQCFPKPWYP